MRASRVGAEQGTEERLDGMAEMRCAPDEGRMRLILGRGCLTRLNGVFRGDERLGCDGVESRLQHEHAMAIAILHDKQKMRVAALIVSIGRQTREHSVSKGARHPQTHIKLILRKT